MPGITTPSDGGWSDGMLNSSLRATRQSNASQYTVHRRDRVLNTRVRARPRGRGSIACPGTLEHPLTLRGREAAAPHMAASVRPFTGTGSAYT